MPKLKRVLSIGYRFQDKRVNNTEFNEPDSSLGHDLIYFDPTDLVRDSYGASGGDGEYIVKGNSARKFESDLDRRSAEFREHLDAGKPVVVAVPSPWKAWLYSHQVGNARLIEAADVLPTEVDLRAARGEAFERIAGEPFSGFWEWTEEVSVYESFLIDPSGTPLVRIAGTNRVVGVATQVGPGLVLYLPRLVPEIGYGGKYSTFATENQAHSDYLDLLWKICQHFGGSAVVPEWTNAYLLPGEGAALQALAKAEKRLSSAQKTIQKRDEELRGLRERKILITGTGDALERIVGRALSALGFEVQPGAPGRTDRVIRRKRRVAVVEIKGKSKSASEKDAAQLEKWKSNYHAEHGRSPKGILIVNAWRGKTLEERRDLEAFPDQMLQFAVKERHQCLLTTTQLLILWLEAEKSKSRAEKLTRELLTCEGRFPHFQDWSEVIAAVEVGEK